MYRNIACGSASLAEGRQCGNSRGQATGAPAPGNIEQHGEELGASHCQVCDTSAGGRGCRPQLPADTLAVHKSCRFIDIYNVVEGIRLTKKKIQELYPGEGYGALLQYLRLWAAQGSSESKNWTSTRYGFRRLSRTSQRTNMWNSCLACMTHEGICRCFSGDNLLAIQDPFGTRPEVPIPEASMGRSIRYI